MRFGQKSFVFCPNLVIIQGFGQRVQEARIGLFNEEQQFAYMVSQKHYWDNHNTLAYSFEKGKKEGDVQARQEVAEKMKAAGIDKKTILEVTGIESDSEV